MAYIRKKKINGNIYYYIVEGKTTEQGKVKQKVILYLGTLKRIQNVFDFWKDKS